MSPGKSFDELVMGLREGDDDAASEVFHRFTRRLIALSSHQFDTWIRPKVDLEDVVQSAFKSFFLRCQGGQFDISDWDEIWGLLALIALRKCVNRREFLRARRRDCGREVSWCGLEPGSREALALVDRDPSPLEAAMLAEAIEQLLASFDLPDREIVALILQGFTAGEVARSCGRAERTVRRVRDRVKRRLNRMRAEELDVT